MDRTEMLGRLVAEVVRRAFQKLPADRRNDLKLNTIKRKMERFSSYTVDKLSPDKFPIMGSAILNFRKLHPDILSRDEYKSWLEKTREKNKNKKTMTFQHLNVDDSEIDEAEIDEEADQTDAEQKIKKAIRSELKDQIGQYALSSMMQDTTPPATVQREMQAIYDQICSTVRDRIEESGLDKERPVLDLLIPSSPKWDDILETITGAKRPLFGPGLSNIRQMQLHNYISLENLMTSVIAAAVLRWTLDPNPLDDLLGKGYHTLLAAITKLDEQGASLLAGDTCIKLLKEYAKPKIPEKAETFAREVDNLLSVYMVPPRRNKVHGGRVVARRVAGSGRNPNNDQSTARKRIRLSEPEWLQEWHNELVRIFKMALKLRVSLEIKGSGRYRFEFPIPGEAWVGTGKGGKQIDQTVFHGISPSVEASFQDIRGGPWSGWKILTDAIVDFDDSTPLEEGVGAAVYTEAEDVKAPIEVPESSNLSDEEEGERDPSFEISDSKGKKKGKKRKGPSK